MCVVGAIEPSLRKAEIDRVKRQRPRNSTRTIWSCDRCRLSSALMPKNSGTRIPLLPRRLKLQPDYAAAHALLSRCFHVRFNRGGAT